jgi:hypothetical protein
MARRSSDHVGLATAMANYMFESSFKNHPLHLEGEEVFGYDKQIIDCPLSVDNESHCLNYVNFFHPKVTIPTIEPNIVEDLCMQ